MGGSQQTIDQELKAIKTIVKSFRDESVSIEDIKDRLDFDIELRTLQRRLAKLQDEGSVAVAGSTRSTRYYSVERIDYSFARVEEDEVSYGIGHPVPLSRASREILAAVGQPWKERKPVGYNRAFLDSYRPNIDRYLTEDETEHLMEIGKTSSPDAPAGTYAREILNRLLIDLSWNSSRLEGNTYSLLDTEHLISTGEITDTKSVLEAQMILNHKHAIEFMVESAGEMQFNRYSILNLHALLSHNLLSAQAACGRLRTSAVGIRGSVFTPLSIPQVIEEMFDLILEKAGQIHDPYEQAFFIMVHLPYLQPFEDVNKRVSRIAANIPFNQHNLSPLSFVDVPKGLYVRGTLGVYELNRVELLKDVYIWAYERSSARYADIQHTIGEPDRFRLRYHVPIRSAITEIVSNAMPLKEASSFIKARATHLPERDQPRFIESVETELMDLHDGNFARYRISPSAFEKWKKVWGKS